MDPAQGLKPAEIAVRRRQDGAVLERQRRKRCIAHQRACRTMTGDAAFQQFQVPGSRLDNDHPGLSQPLANDLKGL
jgi:hypothetical protein